MNRFFPILVLAVAALFGSTPTEASTTMRCESTDGRWKACSVDTYGGVTLARQLSRAGCWQGDTWGYDRNRIWVTNGCRAEFRVGGNRPSSSSGNNNGALAGALIMGAIAGAVIANHNDHDRDDDRRPDCGPRGCGDGWGGGGWSGGAERHFTCESTGGRMTWCRQTVNRREHVELTRQLSRGDCQYGRTWGVDRGEVWVDKGCRAEFVIY